MTGTAYEHRVVCDICGRQVQRSRVDTATFELLMSRTQPDEDDLFVEDQEYPVQVLITRLPGCSRCQGNV